MKRNVWARIPLVQPSPALRRSTATKFQKIGLQVCQLYYPDVLREKLAHALDIKNAMIVNLYHREPVDLEALIAKLTELAERIRPFVADTDAYMMQAVRDGKKILLEGQLGTLRDPDHGIYPMVTSSSPLAGYGRWVQAFRYGASRKSLRLRRRILPAWAPARSQRSCSATKRKELRKRGGDRGEYGATTGRPRPRGLVRLCGDALRLRDAGCDGSRDDQPRRAGLSGRDSGVRGLRDERRACGQLPRHAEAGAVQADLRQAARAGRSDTRGITKFEDLPENARHYVEFLEKEVGCPVQADFQRTAPRRDHLSVKRTGRDDRGRRPLKSLPET